MAMCNELRDLSWIVLAGLSIGACGGQGHVYLSGLKNEATVIGVVADFIAESRPFEDQYSLSYSSNQTISLEGKSAVSGCIDVGSHARVNLLATSGQFDSTVRITVVARADKCDASGDFLDDAIWPNPGTPLPEIPDAGSGGASTGGTAGVGGAPAGGQAGADVDSAGAGG